MPSAEHSPSLADERARVRLRRRATGAVYLAEDSEGQQVALNILIPELARNERFRERFLREARIAASLDEPHVVPTPATHGRYELVWHTVTPKLNQLFVMDAHGGHLRKPANFPLDANPSRADWGTAAA